MGVALPAKPSICPRFGWGTKIYLQNRLEPSGGILHRYHLTMLTSQNYNPNSLAYVQNQLEQSSGFIINKNAIGCYDFVRIAERTNLEKVKKYTSSLQKITRQNVIKIPKGRRLIIESFSFHCFCNGLQSDFLSSWKKNWQTYSLIRNNTYNVHRYICLV